MVVEVARYIDRGGERGALLDRSLREEPSHVFGIKLTKVVYIVRGQEFYQRYTECIRRLTLLRYVHMLMLPIASSS